MEYTWLQVSQKHLQYYPVHLKLNYIILNRIELHQREKNKWEETTERSDISRYDIYSRSYEFNGIV